MSHDTLLLRDLAKEYMEKANDPVNAGRVARIRRTNGLTPDRPAVWIDEIPWNEMDIDGELTLRCEDAFAREIEWTLRKALYRWKHIQADTVLEPFYTLTKACDTGDFGIEVREETISTDRTNHIVSHHYEDELDTDEKLDALKLPVVKADPALDAGRMERAQALLGDTLPVVLRGHEIYYAPWDYISRLRGAEPILIDLMERPDFMHRTISRFTALYTSRFEQMQALGLLEAGLSHLHCTPAYTDDLPAHGGAARFEEVWFRGMAQIFGSISPAMHEEFDLQYMRGMMERCGLSYYGCCEPLDGMIPYLKRIGNMRKIGVSPWANVRACAEQIGGAYVLARKPNPAQVAGTFDEEAVRKETEETVQACLENGCPYELVLKDISTVSYRPQNLIRWCETVQGVLNRYYGSFS